MVLKDSALIEFKNVHFQYQSDMPFILKDVSFQIPKGKWTTIVGHNGSGKSTIAKLIMGIETLEEGSVYFNQEKVTEQNIRDIRKHIGIVFQNPENQFVGSIVKYDVAFGLENHSIPHDDMIQLVNDALTDVNMLNYADYEPQSLSGGQKQRVAIAGVLALSPSVILLDEATSMLDPKAREELMNLIKQIQKEKGISIISITHDLSEAMASDHVIVLDKGKVYQSGSPKSIFNQSSNLENLGLALPFSMKIANLLGLNENYLTYEGLVDRL